MSDAKSAAKRGEKGHFKGWTKGQPMPKTKCPDCAQEYPKGRDKWHKERRCTRGPSALPKPPAPGDRSSPYRFELDDYAPPEPEGEAAEGGEPYSGGSAGSPGTPEPLPASLIAQAADAGQFWGAIADFENSFIPDEYARFRIKMNDDRAKALHTAAMACLPAFFLNPFFIFGSMLAMTFLAPFASYKFAERQDREKAKKAAEARKQDDFARANAGTVKGDVKAAQAATPRPEPVTAEFEVSQS